MRRLAALLIAMSVVAGCGGDEGGSDAPAPEAGSATAAIPADTPVVFEVSADLEDDQWASALAFAERLDPSDRDLAETLKADLFDGEVTYAEVEPFVGDRLAFGLSGVEGDEVKGVVAVEIDDEEEARATLEKASDEGERDATYEEVDYAIAEDGAASGIFEGLLVGASDEASFKAAVDASQGESIADAEQYQEALGQAPDDRLMTAYADVDGLLELLTKTGTVPPEVLEAVEQAPGFEPGATLLASATAEDDAMTFDVAAVGQDGELPEGQSVADLPGEAWFALAGGGAQLGEGILQGLEQSGGAEGTRLADELGLTAFLGGLESLTLRLGGTAVPELNGQAELIGTDAGAARTVVQRTARELRVLGAPVQLEGASATLTIPPLNVLRFEADGGTLRIAAGEQPESDLADDKAFDAARERLDADRVALFVDFAPLEQLLGSVPSDADIEQAQAVLKELGYLIAGTGEDDGVIRSRFVLTLR